MDGFFKSVLLIYTVLARSTYSAQYTRWNILFLCIHRYFDIPVQSVLVSSVTTMIGFQHGATDGTIHRLMARCKLRSIPMFLLADFFGHGIPVLVSAFLVGPRRILRTHVLHAYTWIALYYLLVAKGLNCERQYVVYPWKRQVAAAIVTPLCLYTTWNHDIAHASIVGRMSMAIGAYYTKQWYDALDTIPVQNECIQL